MAYLLVKSRSVRWKLLCCIRCWWLENRRWRPSTAQRRRLKACPWVWFSSAGGMETSAAGHEKSSACHFFGFPNPFKIAVSMKLGKEVALRVAFNCPLFLVARTGLFLAVCGLLAPWESTREAITTCWSLRGTVTKPETTWAKFGTYSLKLW